MTTEYVVICWGCNRTPPRVYDICRGNIEEYIKRTFEIEPIKYKDIIDDDNSDDDDDNNDDDMYVLAMTMQEKEIWKNKKIYQEGDCICPSAILRVAFVEKTKTFPEHIQDIIDQDLCIW